MGAAAHEEVERDRVAHVAKMTTEYRVEQLQQDIGLEPGAARLSKLRVSLAAAESAGADEASLVQGRAAKDADEEHD